MPSADVTVLLKAADGGWTSVGRDIARGIVPESVSVSANESGPDTCSFILKRRAAVPWPDLLAFNQAEVQVGGIPVWGGRVWEAPISDAAEDSIAVSGRGWQYHLDDDMLTRFYVRDVASEMRDMRSFAGQNLTYAAASPSTNSVGGCPSFGWPNNTYCANDTGVGLTYDLGAGRTAKHVVINWNVVNGNAAFTLYVRAHNTDDTFTGTFSDGLVVPMEAATTVEEATFATARRYVSIFLYRDDGVTAITGTDHYVQLYSVRIFSDTAYESGGASILKASTVVRNVLSSGAVPLLSSATDGIETTSFSIPDYAPDGYQTPRQIIAGANAYEGNLVGVDAHRRLFYRERATTPRIEVGEWSGSDFQDATTASAEGIYNRVIVQGTGPDGSQINQIRTLTAGLLDRQGFDRTAVLQIGSPVTNTAAQQIGDIWLAEKATPPMKGTITVKGQGGCRLIGGGTIHPSELLLYVGDRIRLTQLADPETGAWGRDVTVKAVSYSHDTETATVELDNERGNLETLLARFQVTTSQVLR